MTLKTAWERAKMWWKVLKPTKKLLVICLGVIGILIIIIIAVNSLIHLYNDTLGRSCTTDADCKLLCPGPGAINERYFDVQMPSLHIWENRFENILIAKKLCEIGALCEDKRCEAVTSKEVTSPEICERLSATAEKDCYFNLAFNLRNTSYCDYFQGDSYQELREFCIEVVSSLRPLNT